MQLNTLVIEKRPSTDGHHNSYAIELDYRLAGLRALHEANTRPATPPPDFKDLVTGFVSRGGQLHYVIDTDDRVLGSAYVLGVQSLLENLNPVERLFVSNEIDADLRFSVAQALLQSIVESACAAVAKRPDSVWIQVFIPEGAHDHPESQPIIGALEAAGFRGGAMARAELWTRLIENASEA
jgi:hypothetical protein